MRAHARDHHRRAERGAGHPRSMSALPKDAAAPLAEPKQAAAEVIAGRPGPTARRCLGPTTLVVFILFAIDTFLVVQNDVLPTDIPIARFIQNFNWGPLVYPMELINASAGIWQVLLGLIAVVALFILERRAGWLMFCLLYTSPSPRDRQKSRMPSSA